MASDSIDEIQTGKPSDSFQLAGGEFSGKVAIFGEVDSGSNLREGVTPRGDP